MNASMLAPGTVFAGRYGVVRCIAQGGMGAVYEVVHLETERRRALKVMLPHVLQSVELRHRFQREAKIAANVESEFIVDVFDAGFDDATQMPYLVMELLRGEEVSKRLKRFGRLPPAEVVAILHQTALALDKTHRAAIVHRDLKPENLFLTEREDGPPRVKVLDFGIAKVVAESATVGGMTQSLGTPLYMAPEQFNPRAQLTGSADLFALAMVAYKLLVGRAYWSEEAKGGNVFALAAVAIHGPREPASARAAQQGFALPPSFDAWFARATALDPAHRYANGVEMVAALAAALGVGHGQNAAPPAIGPIAYGAPAAAQVASSTTPLGSAALADLPSVTCPTAIPTSSSAPSLPTGIAAPPMAGTTPPPPASKGPSRAIVAAVALGALLGLSIGAVLLVRLGGSASRAPGLASAGPPSAPQAAQPPPEPAVTEHAKEPPPAPSAVPTAEPAASASTAPAADERAAAPSASASATAESAAAAPPKPHAAAPAAAQAPVPPHHRKYTRE